MKADVHGSCVSFSILKKDTPEGCRIKLDSLDNHYFFSHINIAGSMGKKIDVEPAEEELSVFEEHLRRNLITDLNKTVVTELLQSDAEWLLVDFYDFARVQWAYRGGSYTHTVFLNEAKDYYQKVSDQMEGPFRWIDLPTFLYYDKVDEYFRIMVEKYGREHIILNRIYFNRYYIDGDNSLKEIRKNIDWVGSYKDNGVIRRLEDHVIEKFGIKSIDVSKYFVADFNFTKDILAVHYEEEYYRLAGRIISKMVRGEEAAADKLDLEGLKAKLCRSPYVDPGESEGYLSCACSPFHCYEPLDVLFEVLDNDEIISCKDVIIRLYEWVFREPEYFMNSEIPVETIQNKLIEQFEIWMAEQEDQHETVILYGAGTQNLRMAFQPITSAGFEVAAIVDKDKKKQGTLFYGVKVIAPEELQKYEEKREKYRIIITIRTEKTVSEVKNELSGLKYADIYSFHEFIEAEKLNGKVKRFACIMFHLVDHCNMSCVRCSHFSPLAPKDGFYLDEKTFERDCKRLSELTGGDIDEIQLSGGEPTLHPRVHIFPYIVRKYFPKTKIIIITNATRILDMQDEFFQSCRENEVQLWISKYPVKLDYDAVLESLRAKGIAVTFGNTGNSEDKPKEMWGLPMRLEGGMDKQHNFDCCLCMQYIVREGILYPCANSAYIDLFNNYFQKELPGPEVNGVDIYKVKDLEELTQKISQAIPLCEFCDAQNRLPGIPWRVSKKEINEWII